MVTVETIGRVRHAFHVKGRTIKQISRDLRLARNTVRDIVRGDRTERHYKRGTQPRPKLGGFTGELDRLLEANAARPKRERLTFLAIYEALRLSGYEGGYDAVRRYGRAQTIEVGIGGRRRFRRRPMCRWSLPLARPISSTGATRWSSWPGSRLR